MKCKKARAPWELGEEPDPAGLESLRERGLLIEQWDVDDAGAEEANCGAKGSPTRVKKVDSVQLVSEEHKPIEPTEEGLAELVDELMEEHIFD
jgi:electron transfer flavoprotein alpha/beta subunit